MLEGLKRQYIALSHAMQSGVAWVMAKDPSDTTPKHLRIGVNQAMVEHGALVKLLIEKGVFTEVEYYTALNEMMEREIKMYQQRLQEWYGADNISLG
jgi:hypothetical protein